MQEFPSGGQLQTNNSFAEALVWTRVIPRPQTQNHPEKPVRRWTRYERLSFLMMGLAWGLTIAIVAALHFGNYHLETRTSSTAATHREFYAERDVAPQTANPSDNDEEGGGR